MIETSYRNYSKYTFGTCVFKVHEGSDCCLTILRCGDNVTCVDQLLHYPDTGLRFNLLITA